MLSFFLVLLRVFLSFSLGFLDVFRFLLSLFSVFFLFKVSSYLQHCFAKRPNFRSSLPGGIHHPDDAMNLLTTPRLGIRREKRMDVAGVFWGTSCLVAEVI